MQFQNDALDVAELPRLSEDHYQPLQPAYRIQRVLTSFSGWVVVVVATMFAAQLVPAPRWLETGAVTVSGGLTIASTVFVCFEYANRGWVLRDHDISFRRGLISRSVTTVPFTRVQHVSVSAGGFERVLGLASLEIFTAGSGSADLVVPGLTPDAADRARALVLSRTRRNG